MKSTMPPNSLTTLVAALDEEAVLKLVRQRIKAGDEPLQIIEEYNAGMRLVGQKYENREYFVSGLIMSGEIFREVVELVQPLMQTRNLKPSKGLILVGTVSGDIHDIGKSMASMLLSCHGFTVVDLGVDVPAETFAEKAVQIQPDVVGLSGLITASFEMMKVTVRALREKSNANHVSFPIIVGGGMINEQVNQYVGADYWVSDAMSGVRLCQRLLEERNRD